MDNFLETIGEIVGDPVAMRTMEPNATVVYSTNGREVFRTKISPEKNKIYMQLTLATGRECKKYLPLTNSPQRNRTAVEKLTLELLEGVWTQ